MLSAEEQIDLLCDLLGKGESVTLEVTGSCMRPWAFDGDTIAVSPPPASWRRGMIVLVRRGRQLYAHRVVEIAEGAGLRIRGDALDRDGLWVGPDQVLGQVTAVHHRWGFTLDLRSPWWQLVGWAAAPVVRLGLHLVPWMRRLVRPGARRGRQDRG